MGLCLTKLVLLGAGVKKYRQKGKYYLTNKGARITPI
jgi:hypothetical protein